MGRPQLRWGTKRAEHSEHSRIHEEEEKDGDDDDDDDGIR
jgi:hypothetical protein